MGEPEELPLDFQPAEGKTDTPDLPAQEDTEEENDSPAGVVTDFNEFDTEVGKRPPRPEWENVDGEIQRVEMVCKDVDSAKTQDGTKRYTPCWISVVVEGPDGKTSTDTYSGIYGWNFDDPTKKRLSFGPKSGIQSLFSKFCKAKEIADERYPFPKFCSELQGMKVVISTVEKNKPQGGTVRKNEIQKFVV